MNFQPVLDSLYKIVTDIIDFIPRFINGMIILIVGYLVSVLVRAVVRFVLRRIRLEQLAERTGIASTLRGLGINVPLSQVLASTVFFFLILSFATASVRLMELESVAELLQNVVRFIPKAISASLLLIFGSMLARFLGNTVAAIAATVNITYSSVLGRMLEYAIVIFAAVLAISTLGVDTTLLTTSITIIVGAAGLAIALTFGLGSGEAARNVIAGYYVRQHFSPGQQLTVGSYTGTVRSTTGAYTTLEIANPQNSPETGAVINSTRTVSIPNALLLKDAIPGQQNPPTPQG